MPTKELFFTPINLSSLQVLDSGSGTPESSVTATPGSVYLDTDGKLWLKESGSGNTGWAQLGVPTSPAGSDTELQFNDSGSFGASSSLTWNDASSYLFSPKIRVGEDDCYLGFDREATDGTGNNLDNGRIQSTGTDAHTNLVLATKGLGGVQFQSTSYAKNQPGFNALDLQLYHGSTTQVASGLYAACVGAANTGSGTNAVCLGSGNQATATQTTSVGTSTRTTATGATAVGHSCEANASYAVAIGQESNARIQGMTAFASGEDTTAGDRQSGKLHLVASTTDATTTSATVGGGSLSAANSLTLDEGMAVAGTATYIARNSGSTDRYYERRRFYAYRNSGGNVTVTIDTSEASSKSLSLNSGSTNITGNSTYQCIDFQLTGAASVSVDWLCVVEWSELAV